MQKKMKECLAIVMKNVDRCKELNDKTDKHLTTV